MQRSQEILREIPRGSEFLRAMEDLGLDNRLQALEIKLSRLNLIWEITRQYRTVDKDLLASRVASLFPAFEESEVYSDFVEEAVFGIGNFEAGVIRVCQAHGNNELAALLKLAAGIGEIDVNAPSVFLLPYERPEYLELSIQPKGLGPRLFLAEITDDLDRLRHTKDSVVRKKSIIAFSWLLDQRKAKTAAVLNRLDLESNSARIRYFDENIGLLPEDELEREKVRLAARSAIPLAAVNLARYLQKGELPRVGVLTVAAADFWR